MCQTYQIPHSQFLGGPPRWTDLDRVKALAFAAWQREACPDCGTRPQEWVPALGGDRDAYVADYTYCPGCARLRELEKSVEDTDRARGIHLHLVPLEVALARQDAADEEVSPGG